MKWNESRYTQIIEQRNPMEVYGTITFADGSTRDISCADIPVDGLTIERRAVTGDNFEIGASICGELDLKLYISDSEDYIKYYDATLALECRVIAKPAIENTAAFWVPLGVWTFIDIKKSKNILNILAYDSMLNLDTKLKRDLTGEWREILPQIRSDCDINIRWSDVNNSNNVTLNFPMKGGRCTTYRQVVTAIAQMCGCYVVCNPIQVNANSIDVRQFDNSPQTVLEFAPSNIFTSHVDAHDYAINFIELELDDTLYSISSSTTPTSGHTYNLQNPVAWEIIKKQYGNSEVNNLNNELGECLFSLPKFRPCELTTFSDPRIECGDRYILRHDGGVSEIIVTGFVWRLNGPMEITCAGKDERLVRTSTSSSNYNSYYINEAGAASVEESAIILHQFTNSSKVVSDEDFPLIADVTFLANRDTFVTFNGTLQVDVDIDDITEEAQITIGDSTHTIPYRRDGCVDIYLLYKFNSDWIGPRYKHTLTRGSHIITLHYPLISIERFSVSSFGVYISSSAGNVSIDKEMFIGTITGQGIAKALTWDGAIVLEDFTTALTIPEAKQTLVDFDEQIICEYVERNDSSFSEVVDNTITQAVTMVDITDTVQLSTVEGE